ncbi:hypothetical protein KIW84_045162 [Lathyrus oleraceus]|uniref:Uncharacterized protein n=1 Tax=Pisum sativum TaxID=3888 RepID=A0A9D5AWW8_PEA|nr:hypothetical protein KIW84_045162 [Pisum sativum]
MFPSISVTPTSSTHVSIIVPLTFSSFNTSSPTSLPATPSYTQHNTPLSLHSGTSQTQNLPSNSLPSPDSVPDSSGSRPNQPTSPMSPSSDSHTCNTSSSSASTQLSSPTSSSAHIHKPPSPRVHPHNTHSMITRAKDGIVQLKLHLTLLITELEPSSYKTALKNPNTTAEVLWVQSLLAELKIHSLTPVLYCDNLSTVALSHNPVLHSKTKHMEFDIFFLREKRINKTFYVKHIPAHLQNADLLTKPLSALRFLALRDHRRVCAKSIRKREDEALKKSTSIGRRKTSAALSIRGRPPRLSNSDSLAAAKNDGSKPSSSGESVDKEKDEDYIPDRCFYSLRN